MDLNNERENNDKEFRHRYEDGETSLLCGIDNKDMGRSLPQILDTRYHASDVMTYDLDSHKAISTKNSKDVEKDAIKSDAIGVDEGLFHSDIVDFLTR